MFSDVKPRAVKSASTLRVPLRSRTVARSDAPWSLDDASLGRSLTVTQLLLLGWCAARVGVDLRRGALGLDGCIALAVIAALAPSLARRVI